MSDRLNWALIYDSPLVLTMALPRHRNELETVNKPVQSIWDKERMPMPSIVPPCLLNVEDIQLILGGDTSRLPGDIR